MEHLFNLGAVVHVLSKPPIFPLPPPLLKAHECRLSPAEQKKRGDMGRLNYLRPHNTYTFAFQA